MRAPTVPAPGYRGCSEDELWYVGSHGYSWACTPVTGDGTVRYLASEPGMFNPSYVGNRGHGLQLRCLSE
ncbi:hypothetical protein [uncultured Rikenella sp.]|uniref:hypothetical protein n=1 Tax=uncultured Rikenella sp. TaxID=368003 RepID=UPI0026199C17|nr:hypothetical protein [uncultured Rikenella sp.]